MEIDVQVLCPSDVARREILLLPSELDSGSLPVKISSVTHMYSDMDTLNNFSGELAHHRFCIRLAPQEGTNSSECWHRNPTGRGKSKLCLRVALRKDATSHDGMMALLAACEARRSLCELVGVSMGGKRQGKRGKKCDWNRIWDSVAGDSTAEATGRIRAAEKVARKSINRVKKDLVREGWLCDHVLLSQSERVRYSIA
jgi:hypothetical protein